MLVVRSLILPLFLYLIMLHSNLNSISPVGQALVEGFGIIISSLLADSETIITIKTLNKMENLPRRQKMRIFEGLILTFYASFTSLK